MPQEKHPQPGQDQDKGYTPASPVKRTLAWIALVYVLMLLALTTYYFYTGTTLGNLAPLLTIPGLVGLGVVVLVSAKSTGSPKKLPAIVLALVCWIMAAVTVPIAFVGLMSNFGG